MFLVQISDTHIDEPDTLVYGYFDTAAALEKAVDAINACLLYTSPSPRDRG